MFINTEKLNEVAGKIFCSECGWSGIQTAKEGICPDCGKGHLLLIEKIEDKITEGLTESPDE